MPDSIETTKTINVDNTNPILVSGAGTSISTGDTHEISLATTPVVSEVTNTFEFSVYSEEYLPALIDSTAGWNVDVRKQDGSELVNNYSNPPVAVNAQILSITPKQTVLQLQDIRNSP